MGTMKTPKANGVESKTNEGRVPARNVGGGRPTGNVYSSSAGVSSRFLRPSPPGGVAVQGGSSQFPPSLMMLSTPLALKSNTSILCI